MNEPESIAIRCAVVLVTRGDLVLALPRGRGRETDAIDWLADLHLPGGKEEIEDGGDLRSTAARELLEETGLRVRAEDLRHVADAVAPGGFFVAAFALQAPDGAPDHFAATSVGQPAWVQPAALLQPWCSLASVAEVVLVAAGVAVGSSHALCPDCETWHVAAREPAGLRLPVHRSYPGDPRSLALCSCSLALLDAEGAPRIDQATADGLLEFVGEARATASLAHALRDLGSRGLDAGRNR